MSLLPLSSKHSILDPGFRSRNSGAYHRDPLVLPGNEFAFLVGLESPQVAFADHDDGGGPIRIWDAVNNRVGLDNNTDGGPISIHFDRIDLLDL